MSGLYCLALLLTFIAALAGAWLGLRRVWLGLRVGVATLRDYSEVGRKC